MTSSKARIEYEILLRMLHKLIAEGRDESDEGDTIRDAMDRPWDALDYEGREAMRKLSGDLWKQNE